MDAPTFDPQNPKHKIVWSDSKGRMCSQSKIERSDWLFSRDNQNKCIGMVITPPPDEFIEQAFIHIAPPEMLQE